MSIKRIIILAAASISLSGCASTFVKPMAANENQFIVKHGLGWYEQATEQANANCAKYGKQALMQNTDCNQVDPLYGKACMTIWNCK